MDILVEADKVYKSIQSSAIINVFQWLAIGLAVLFVLVKIVKIIRGAYDKEKGGLDLSAVKDLMGLYIFVLLFASLSPKLMTVIEQGLLEGQTYLISLWDEQKPPPIPTNSQGLAIESTAIQRTPIQSSASNNQNTIIDGSIEELDAENKKQTEGSTVLGTLFNGLSDIVNTVGILMIKPIILFLTKWLYYYAVIGRYLFLILLEIAAPIAIVSLLSDKHSNIFVGWFKNMFSCYMLIPVFLLANVLGDKMAIAFYTDDYSIIFLLVQFLGKLFLFSYGAKKVFSLL